MKKIMILMALLAAFVFVSCGGNNDDDEDNSTSFYKKAIIGKWRIETKDNDTKLYYVFNSDGTGYYGEIYNGNDNDYFTWKISDNIVYMHETSYEEAGYYDTTQKATIHVLQGGIMKWTIHYELLAKYNLREDEEMSLHKE